MVDKQLTIGMLFPLRKTHEALTDLCSKFPVELVDTPYLEPNELRSSRGLNKGKNSERVKEPDIDEKTLKQWQNCNAIVGMDIPSNPQNIFPNLKWFQGVSAGYDHIDSKALHEIGAIQTNARGVSSSAVAEFVFARLLQIWKELRLLDKQQAEFTWKVRFGSEAVGKTIGIVGLGSIGREVAMRANAFGMTVFAARKTSHSSSTDAEVDQLFRVDQLTEMIGQSDVVVMAAPASEETRDIFNSRMFKIMKPGAIFCNIARGMHVVEEDLIDALNSGHLKAAVLDVTRIEPLPLDSPLWTQGNMYLSPHCSVSFDNYEENAVALLVENAERYLLGKKMVNVVSAI